jgi:hypothetical protein
LREEYRRRGWIRSGKGTRGTPFNGAIGGRIFADFLLNETYRHVLFTHRALSGVFVCSLSFYPSTFQPFKHYKKITISSYQSTNYQKKGGETGVSVETGTSECGNREELLFLVSLDRTSYAPSWSPVVYRDSRFSLKHPSNSILFCFCDSMCVFARDSYLVSV